jgi:3-phosphoshikimate 1-carboxyvinyltransferase
MMEYDNQISLSASSLKGSIRIPPSKSHTLRSILFAFMAKGRSHIFHPLYSSDTDAMLRACAFFGGNFRKESHLITIDGVNGEPKAPEDIIDVGNSGQVLRFMGAISAISGYPAVLTGDHSIRHIRPINSLTEGLIQLGVKAFSLKQNGFSPVFIQGPLKSGYAIISGQDSQPVSGLLIAGAFAPGPIEIFVTEPGEKPWVDLTLAWFDRLGISYQRTGHDYFSLPGKTKITSFNYSVPGDFSSAAFPIGAALITESEVILDGLDYNDSQGDKRIIDVLREMGAVIEIDERQKKIVIKKSARLKGRTIHVNDFIDAVPILAVLACYAEGKTHILGAKNAKKKECDRLSCLTQELRKMGGKIEELPDGLLITPAQLKGATVESYSDHRMAMALAVAGLGAAGKTTIRNLSCVSKSYPDFFLDLKKLGAYFH